MNFRLRLCLTALAFICSASVMRAELVWIEPKDGGDVTTIKLSVTPAPEPEPAFKYRLTVRPIDEKPGNAAVWYYRALLEEEKIEKVIQEKYGEEYHEWISPSGMKLSQLPLEKVRQALSTYKGVTNDSLAMATVQRECDWELRLQQMKGMDFLEFLLPEIQQLRHLSRMLALRTRLAVAEHRYDDAVEALRMNYQLAQHSVTDPILVCVLVGIAEASLANAALHDLIAASGSPNMYWALTELPSPLIGMRDSIRFELEIGQRIFPFLIDAETAIHADEEWRLMWSKALSDLMRLESRPSTVRQMLPAEFGVLGLATLNYGHSKNALIAWGFDPERVEAMPVGQVLAIYSKRTYERIAQRYEQAMLVPFTEAERFAEQAEDLIKHANPLSGSPDREIIPIASMLLPAVNAARNAEVRLQREFAALRTIEALRMHAAENDGELPKKLSEITCVPVPENPVTGQPFVYYREGKTAVLELPKSDGLRVVYRYEITMAP